MNLVQIDSTTFIDANNISSIRFDTARGRKSWVTINFIGGDFICRLLKENDAKQLKQKLISLCN